VYDVSTILTNNMAYKNARLIAKPAPDWLEAPISASAALRDDDGDESEGASSVTPSSGAGQRQLDGGWRKTQGSDM
jgi:hypothetical protein